MPLDRKAFMDQLVDLGLSKSRVTRLASTLPPSQINDVRDAILEAFGIGGDKVFLVLLEAGGSVEIKIEHIQEKKKRWHDAKIRPHRLAH
jgi:hypothetical protein